MLLHNQTQLLCNILSYSYCQSIIIANRYCLLCYVYNYSIIIVHVLTTAPTCVYMCVSVMRQTNSTNRGSPLVSRNGCKCKYRVRWFYSKGAFLVLVWNMLLTMACTSAYQMFNEQPYVDFVIPKSLFAIPVVFGLLGAVFSRWLADAKLGNYRVMKYSFVLSFLISLLYSAFTLVPDIAHYTCIL